MGSFIRCCLLRIDKRYIANCGCVLCSSCEYRYERTTTTNARNTHNLNFIHHIKWRKVSYPVCASIYLSICMRFVSFSSSSFHSLSFSCINWSLFLLSDRRTHSTHTTHWDTNDVCTFVIGQLFDDCSLCNLNCQYIYCVCASGWHRGLVHRLCASRQRMPMERRVHTSHALHGQLQYSQCAPCIHRIQRSRISNERKRRTFSHTHTECGQSGPNTNCLLYC